MANALQVADYIVRRFQDRGDLITNLKLQKLLYYVQGWHLGLHHRRAFQGDFMAWVHGPVNYEVYNRFRHLRWTPIIEEIRDPELDDGLKSHVDDVLAVYGGDSAWELEQRTHSEAPWIRARGGLAPDAECRAVISDAHMEEFFSGLARDAEDTETAG